MVMGFKNTTKYEEEEIYQNNQFNSKTPPQVSIDACGGGGAEGATKYVNSFVTCLASLYDDPTNCSYFLHCRFLQSDESWLMTDDAKGGDLSDNDNNDIRE